MMARLWQWLIGIDSSSDWTSNDGWRLEFNSLPQGPWAAAAIAAAILSILGVWWLYRKEGREVPGFARAMLVVLRLGVLACVAVMLLELTMVFRQTELIPSRLLVLLDTSDSMNLKDPYVDEEAASRIAERLGQKATTDATDGGPDVASLRETTRLDLAKRGAALVLPELSKGRELSAYTFAGELTSLADPNDVLKAPAGGTTTALGQALRDAIDAHKGQTLAGVLVLTDGQSNIGIDPVRVAGRAGRDKVPIVSLAVGTSHGPRNAVLAGIEASPVVFVQDPTEVSVMVESRGLEGTTAQVALEQRGADGNWTEIGREDVILGEDKSLVRTTFPFTPEGTGRVEFRARVSDVGPELDEADNVATESIKVVRQEIRLLLIAGAPSPELQFLRNALLRDEALEMATWLQTAEPDYEHVGHRPIRRLPNSQQELDYYDVLVLIDPDMAALGPIWSEMITDFVGESGGGLIYIAGELHTANLFNPTFSVDADASAAGVANDWIKVLPVVRDPGLYQSSAIARLSTRDTYNLELTPQGYEDVAFRFSENPNRNREVLASLPGMYWHFPVTRAKPGATVLARHGDPRMQNSFGRHVLLATQLYGPGRAVFIGFDTTYRWRYLDEDYFDGFWARLIDRAGRNKVLLGGLYPIRLATDKSSYRIGDQIVMRAEFVNPGDASEALSQLAGELEIGEGVPQELDFQPVEGELGAFEASLVTTEAGAYTVRVLPNGAAEAEASPKAAVMQFRVDPPRREMNDPTLNRALLDRMARASGGQTFTLAECDQVPAAFSVREVERVLEMRDEVWDAPLLFGGLFLLLCVEWILRKRYRMA